MSKRRKHSIIPQGASSSVEDDVSRRNKKRAARAAQKAQEIEKLKEAGNRLFNAGDFSGAASLYTEAITSFGPKPLLLSNLSAAYLKLEMYEEAEETATTALQYDPKMIKARYRRGIARKEQNYLKAAITDFETIVANDVSCKEAQTQLDIVQDKWERGEGIEVGGYYSEYDWPPYDGEAYDSSSESDSSDCQHLGNLIPCRFYNHEGCSRGRDCAYSHAPDDKSVRDNLGKNVCLYFLLDMCKFGASKCVYSHTKVYLPSGWWDNKDEVVQARELLALAEMHPHHLPAFNDFVSSVSGGTSASRRSGFVEKFVLGEPSGIQVNVTPKGPVPVVAESPSKAFVMLLALDGDDMTERYSESLIAGIRAKLELVKAVTSDLALRHLASPDLAGVLVTDAGITNRKNANILRKLVEFTKSGGSVVLGGAFSSHVRPLDLNSFFEKSWGLTWKSGPYHRETFFRHSSHDLVKKNASLPPSYSMKALHVKDIKPEVAVYRPTQDSRVESLGSASQQVSNFSESPAVQTRMGDGYLGYVGDVNYEEGSSNVILAMLGLLDAPLMSSASHESLPELVPITGNGTATSDTATGSKSNSKSNKRFVMLLSLENEDWFSESYAPLLSALRAKIEWKQALTSPSALGMLGSPCLSGVLVTDPGVTRPRNAQVLSKLVEYVKSGGSAVVGTMFPTFMPLGEFDAFFQKSWGTSWKQGSYHRTTFALNPSNEMVKKNPSLTASYSMKALHVSGLAPGDAIYLPTENARLQSMVFAPVAITDRSESPAVQTRVGRGYFGYIGDVNAEAGSTKVILAMLGLLDSPNVPSVETARGTSAANAMSMKPKPRPFIMVLSFTNVGFFTQVQGDLMTRLQKKIEVLHGLSNERVIDLISSPDLSGILVTDTALVDNHNAYLLDKLVEYTKAGGTVVLGGTFGTDISPDELKKFFSDAWGMPWEMGNYTRTDITINGKHELAKKTTSLPSPLRVKAVHLRGVTPAMALYVASRNSHIYAPLKKITQAPIVHTKVGQGYLGYLGDVGLEEGHTKIVLAMFGLLD